MIFLCARSPDAPKMTRTHGSGVRRRVSPSASGFSVTALCSLFGALLQMAAEGVAHRGEDAVAPVRLGAWREAGVARGGQHRRRDAFLDRRLNRPAALARVADMAGVVVEVRR